MTAKNRKLLTACISVLLVALVLFANTIIASAYDDSIFPYTFNITNPLNVPHSTVNVSLFNQTWHTEQNVLDNSLTATQPIGSSIADMVVSINENEVSITGIGVITDFENTGIPYGDYNVLFYADVEAEYLTIVAPRGNMPTATLFGATDDGFLGMYVFNENDFITSGQYQLFSNNSPIDSSITQITMVLLPITDLPPTECPTLEEQIADFDGSWYMFEQMLKTNNYELWMKYSAELADVGSIEYSKGLSQGYQNGYNNALSGNSVEDPIDQYWNSTKDYILIAGQPYFAPNGFGAIDPYNTIGIYGEHESQLHKQDGSTQAFNGQFVTEFASTGTLGGGWYKLGATVGDEYAYEQTLTTTYGDKAYYVSRVSSLGDPVEEFLVAIWVDGYEAWYVAEEYAHHGTVANNDNKSYKQVYSIYLTDISPTAQRFVNYDNPILHETFNEDINATLYLATFNQLNNYNVYTDDIGIVESYNNGFDAGANTTLWTDLISQPVVAFFSIPLAQVIVEGVTYTITYGIVLGAGIVGLIVIWFLKLFAGG